MTEDQRQLIDDFEEENYVTVTKEADREKLVELLEKDVDQDEMSPEDEEFLKNLMGIDEEEIKEEVASIGKDEIYRLAKEAANTGGIPTNYDAYELGKYITLLFNETHTNYHL